MIGLPGVHATDLIGKADVRINTPTSEDLYITTNTLEINAPIAGDVLALARYCYIRDSILEDVMLVAQEVQLAAPILDDARLVGGNVYIRADILGDLFIAGGTVTVDREVTIHGNIYLLGGTLHMNGHVLGESKIMGGEMTVGGTLDGISEIHGGTVTLSGIFNAPLELVSDQATITEQAKFFKDIRYWNAAGELDFGSSLQDGSRAIQDNALRSKQQEGDWEATFGLSAAAYFIFRLLAAAVIIALLVWMIGDFLRRTSERLNVNYPRSLGYGMAYIFGVPLLILLLLITVIGIPVGLFTAATYGFSLGWAPILAALLTVYWWQTHKGVHWKNGKVIGLALVVFAVLKLVSWIPILGWLVGLLVAAIAIGAVILELLHQRELRRTV